MQSNMSSVVLEERRCWREVEHPKRAIIGTIRGVGAEVSSFPSHGRFVDFGLKSGSYPLRNKKA